MKAWGSAGAAGEPQGGQRPQETAGRGKEGAQEVRPQLRDTSSLRSAILYCLQKYSKQERESSVNASKRKKGFFRAI